MKAQEKHELVGEIQLDFLKSQGLQPHHRLLDIGCGWLRGGEWLIDYLNTGRYVGIEKDPDMLARAKSEVLSRSDVIAKSPHIVEGVPTPELMGDLGEFDYGLAHSVLTHLVPDQIVDLLQTVMPHLDVFYASFNRSTEVSLGKPHKSREGERTRCQYPFTVLSELGRRVGCHLEDLGEFGHPSGQEMIRVRQM